MAQRMVVVKPKRGDLIEIPRGSFCHWAIYVGDGYVIHLTTPGGSGSSSTTSVSINRGIVKKEKLLAVVGDDTYYINNLLDDKYEPNDVGIILSDAESRVGQELSYSLIHRNCEHFVTELRYGKPESRQVRVVVNRGIFAGVIAFILGMPRMLRLSS